MRKLFFLVIFSASAHMVAPLLLGVSSDWCQPAVAATAAPATLQAQQQETTPVTPPAPQAPAPPQGAAPALQTTPSPQTTPPKSPAFVVVLDPAHGGPDSGARGTGGIVESELVLDFARAIRVALEAQGLRVVLTREGNQAPSLDARSAMVNAQHGAIFVSLHISSTGRGGTVRTYWYNFEGGTAAQLSSTGTPSGSAPDSALHRGLVQWDQAQKPYSDSSRRLAEVVQAEIAQKFPGSNGAAAPAPVRQLRTVAALAIAIEVSSVAVPDAQQLVKMAGGLADAVARGVVAYRTAAGGER